MSRVWGACISMAALCVVLASAARAQVADRYGPTAPAYDTSTAPAPGSAVLAGAPIRMLSWPGKVTPAPAAMTPPQDQAPALRPALAFAPPTPWTAPAPRPRTAPPVVAAAPPVYPQARYVPPAVEAPPPAASGAPHYGLVQAFARPSVPTQAAPTLYDDAPAPSARMTSRQAAADPRAGQPAPASPAPSVQTASIVPADPAHPGWAPPRRPWSQAGDQSVRFYSLHRQYGVPPDPAPIPPQFFAATADLSAPAGPSPRNVSGAGTAAQAARAAQAEGADTSANSSPP